MEEEEVTNPQVLVICDRPDTAVIQTGQPPAQMAAWLLDIAKGSDANTTVSTWIETEGMPLGTVIRVIDLTKTPLVLTMFTLSSQLVPHG